MPLNCHLLPGTSLYFVLHLHAVDGPNDVDDDDQTTHGHTGKLRMVRKQLTRQPELAIAVAVHFLRSPDQEPRANQSECGAEWSAALATTSWTS